ncbi:peptidase domain-containing ABC transporter [Hyphococcus sp.]|uniref:peptidase domain-containing ABC transporter n=1 Tax=Hyphococcus sp. TaxID=2038636 RepID=UPI003CCBDF64
MPHADDVESVAAFRSVLFRLGYKTTAETVTKKNLRAEYLPCFICRADGSVLLAEKLDNDGLVTVFDSTAQDSRIIPADQLDGLAIFPEAIEVKEPQSGAAAPTWSSAALTAFKPVIRQIFLISFLVNLFALAPPLFVMTVYDKAVGAKSFDVLIGLAIGISFVLAADFALRQVRVRLQSYLGARLDEQLNETAFRHLLHLSLSYTEDAPIGSQLTRLRQMTSLHEAFTGPLANAFFDLPFLIMFIAVIALIGGPLVWVPIALVAVYGVLAAWALPKTSKLVRQAGDVRAQLNNLTVEAVSAQRAIHDLAAEHIWLRRQRRLSAQAAVANMKARQLNFLIQTISQSMVAVAGVAILTIGAGQVIAGELSAGALIAVMALSWRVLGPIRNLFMSALTLGQTVQSIQQVDRLVRMPLEREPNAGPSIPRSFKGHVVFDKISFRYPGAREPSLRGVSFDVKPGEILCLYGQSGSGTSTALRVLMGLYQQQAGSIFVDGLDLRQLDKGEWRNALGVALQSPDLFHGTVAQNIRLARADASDEEIDAVVRKLGIDRYFGGALDEGLDTRCSVMARATWPDPLVSRIILARAFIKNAPVYLLDEPAATLDYTGERALLSLLEERRRTSAIIMTTQRPSHMRLADKVIWLDRGVVRDMGPPDQIVPKIMAA